MLEDKKEGNRRNRSPRRNRSFPRNERREKKFYVYVQPPSRFDTYTALNTSIEQILHAISNEKYVRKPWPTKPKPNADKSKRCDYHKEFGDTTQECQKLKDEIEWLMQHNYLKEYNNIYLKALKGKASKGEQSMPDKQLRGTINTIMGATETWAVFKRKRNQHL